MFFFSGSCGVEPHAGALAKGVVGVDAGGHGHLATPPRPCQGVHRDVGRAAAVLDVATHADISRHQATVTPAAHHSLLHFCVAHHGPHRNALLLGEGVQRTR